MERGYVQVYTGDGKGKTTAALGLAVRAAGAGLSVYIAQFMKMGEYSEIKALSRFSDLITVEQHGLSGFVKTPRPADVRAAQKGLAKAKEAMLSGDWDLVILEEANVAAWFGLFSVEDLLALVREKPEGVELVFTGRNAHPDLIEAADLVTEMKPVKHYWFQGVAARTGIEK
ncbi:MAG: cob(I)yrinic acid a,c-diamide adenosyltransferase [Deltaproteobacteria bacterium]|nr:cob(I)yrinic acid a,c-diamide adenosyltransferase [Deltaproteobacteria bacterium]